MTRPDAQPTPPAPSATEVEYVRKLSLAILSTLQAKGLLSADEVDAILIAARRAAQGVPATPAAAPRAETAPAMQVTVQPAPSLTFHAHARAPQVADASGESPETTADDVASAQAASPDAEAPVAEPLTIEAPSQPIELGPDVVEDPATPSAPLGTEAQDAPQISEDGPVATDVPAEELDIEPPAQTIVIGPDEVAEETAVEAVTAAADDLVLDGATPAKPAEDPKPAVPTFDLKLD
ncbi:hypothetical protein [Deinococcus sp. NW-56]|uniref:hypothetical protein n=1 Tax=Deinococcus sp. NW-56 TaxID=2080419 RepID=UPI000CF4C5DE|nr:hypothetical protein [Deinococcus sp. NW-56]